MTITKLFLLTLISITIVQAHKTTLLANPGITALHGTNAIEEIKRNGLYYSLDGAFRAAQNQEHLPEQNSAPAVSEKGADNDSASLPKTVIGFRQQSLLTASDGATGDFFGNRVAISGDTAIVSANGAAYIFVRNNGTWTLQVKLTANGGAQDSDFGGGIAISGDTAIVGASASSSSGYQGKAYVFTRNGTTWTQQAQLFPDDGIAGDNFGFSVALSGDTAIIGAPFKKIGANFNQGAAYVFVRNNGTWAQQTRLTASDGVQADNFGESVAVSGETAIVGAPTNGGIGQPGAAYVFVRDSAAKWSQQARLVASDRVTDDSFGFSVALSGDTASIRASTKFINTPRQGAAYVFVRNGTAWIQQARLTASDGQSFDTFGFSVAVSGDIIIVGANGKSINNSSGQGAAYAFVRNGATWTQKTRLVGSDGHSSDNFGTSVALSGDTVIIGAYTKDINGNGNQGAAYVFINNTSQTLFDFDGDGKSDVSVYRPEGGNWYLLNSQAGFSSAQFGVAADKIVPADYDGDGKTDLAVYRSGTWYLNRSQMGFTGIAFGEPNDIPQPADFDGDGKADLALWRPSNGVWYVFNLATNQFTSTQFGAPTDKPVIGDYNGDGKADYAVYRPSNGFWYIARSTGVPAQNFDSIQFGDSQDKLVPADYDGDGKTDVAVFRPSNGSWYRLNSTTGQFAGVQFGISTDVPTPADYDGDGKADIAVFRSGTWYLQQSTAGFTGIQFGAGTDKPIENVFIP